MENFGQKSVVVTPGATFQRYLEYLNEIYGAALQHIELAKYAIKRETTVCPESLFLYLLHQNYIIVIV